ncbi:hypothetical protein [Phyllobacterium sophorae]|nr:hypothetical protein [Phyllobacterium sophorae]
MKLRLRSRRAWFDVRKRMGLVIIVEHFPFRHPRVNDGEGVLYDET